MFVAAARPKPAWKLNSITHANALMTTLLLDDASQLNANQICELHLDERLRSFPSSMKLRKSPHRSRFTYKSVTVGAASSARSSVSQSIHIASVACRRHPEIGLVGKPVQPDGLLHRAGHLLLKMSLHQYLGLE